MLNTSSSNKSFRRSRQIVYTRRGLCGDGAYDFPPPEQVFEPGMERDEPPYTAEDGQRDFAWFQKEKARLAAEGRGPVLAIRDCRIIAEAPTFAALEAQLKKPNGGYMEVFVAKILREPVWPPVKGGNR